MGGLGQRCYLVWLGGGTFGANALKLDAQIAGAEHYFAFCDLLRREPAHSMDVLGLKIDGWRGGEASGADEVPGFCLAAPVPHREEPCQVPQAPLDLGVVHPEFLSELSPQRLFGSLTIVDPTSGAGPEPVLDLKPGPMEMDQEFVVVFIQDQRSSSLANPERCAGRWVDHAAGLTNRTAKNAGSVFSFAQSVGYASRIVSAGRGSTNLWTRKPAAVKASNQYCRGARRAVTTHPLDQVSVKSSTAK